MVDHHPVERLIRYATRVDTLAEAWTFVMDRLDEIGPRPRIEIKPASRSNTAINGDIEWTNHFDVAISGMTEHPTEGERS